MNRRYLAVAALAVALVLIVAFASSCTRASGKEQPALSENAVPVRLVPVQDLSYAEPVVATGMLTTADELELSFKVGGVIAAVRVQEGERVHRGQVLSTLDLREIGAAVAKAGTGLGKAERDLARVRNLARDSVATLEQLQDATSGLELARADYNAAKFNERYASIVAPADGVILRKLAEGGELAAPGRPVLVLGSAASGAVVKVGVADRDVVRLHLGDAASVTFSAYPNQVFRGVVSVLPAASNPQTGTFAVEVRLAAPPRMTSGLVGNVTIQPAATAYVRFVPVEAVVEADGSHGYVYTVVGDIARRLPIIISDIDDNRVAIAAGLNNVQRIVGPGAAYLTDGAKVRVVP